MPSYALVNSFPSKFSIDSSSNAAFTLASAFFPFIPFEFIKALAPPAATATPAETRATVPILTPTKDPLIKLLSIPLDRLIQTSCKGSNINNISIFFLINYCFKKTAGSSKLSAKTSFLTSSTVVLSVAWTVIKTTSSCIWTSLFVPFFVIPW